MSDDIDPGLRQLFAQTAEHPADEAFVSAVSARTARERPIPPLLGRLATGCVTALAFAAAVGGVGLALQRSAQVITPLITPSPIGMATGLALVAAGAMCLRLLAPFAVRRL